MHGEMRFVFVGSDEDEELIDADSGGFAAWSVVGRGGGVAASEGAGEGAFVWRGREWPLVGGEEQVVAWP